MNTFTKVEAVIYAEVKLGTAVRHLVLATEPIARLDGGEYHIEEALKAMAAAADLLGYVLIPKKSMREEAPQGETPTEEATDAEGDGLLHAGA